MPSWRRLSGGIRPFSRTTCPPQTLAASGRQRRGCPCPCPLTEARKVGGNQRSARSGHPPLTSAAPAPDVRGIIREVIREISDAAPPDDRDDIREDVRALEEREKLVAERDRFRALAEERDRTIEQQQETIRHLRSLLADERRRMMALLTGPPVPWWRRWFR